MSSTNMIVLGGMDPFLTEKAFLNALTVDMALGCSTNSMLHLPAIAHEVGFDFDIAFANPISEKTPNLCHLAPAGPTYMEDLNEAGGVYAVMKELADIGLLHTECMTVTGKTLGENLKELKENGCLKLDSVSSEVVLLEEDLLITMTQAEGFVTEGDNNVTVVMDTRLTPELIEEGFVRELISKIQTMRKEAGFEVMDHIAVSYTADEKVTGIFNKYGEKIQTEVLANAITAGTLAGYQKEWSINGEKVTLAVEKQ